MTGFLRYRRFYRKIKQLYLINGLPVTTEAQLIKTIAGFAPPDALSDDAYYDADTRQIFTTDLLVEDQHFSLDYFSPFDVGVKAAAVNISDIAAMGGQLKYVLVSIGLPTHCQNQAFIEALYQGIQQTVTQFNGAIIGGDTTAAEKLTINITAVGVLPHGSVLGQRHQAQPGDWIITTGFSGLSNVGLQIFQNPKQFSQPYTESKQAHLQPQPQILAGQQLASSLSRYALMDTSDGLADAVLKLAECSQVAMEIEAACLPLHDELRAFSKETGASPLDLMLYGGEDFQLLATVPPQTPLSSPWELIGTVLPLSKPQKPFAYVKNAADEQIPLAYNKTYQHFSGF